MNRPVVVASLYKNVTEEVRISIDQFKGVDLLDMRVFADFGGPAKVKMPTKKGLSLRVAMLPELIAALTATADKAREMGLIGGEG